MQPASGSALHMSLPGTPDSSCGTNASRRIVSSVFRGQPFMRTILISGKDDDLLEVARCRPEYLPLICCLIEYESQLFGTKDDLSRLQTMRDLLKIKLLRKFPGGAETKLVSKSDARANWNAAQHGRLFSLITIYRLLDTIALVYDIGEGAPVIDRSFSGASLDRLPGYECLLDWPSTLLRLRDIVGASPTSARPLETNASVSRRLLQYLHANAGSMLQGRLMLNFATAAMHLAYIKETYVRENMLPDLPDQINEDVIRRTASVEERAFLVDLRDLVIAIAGPRHRVAGGGLSLACFRGPLQIALALSPIYLLSTKLLGNKDWSRKTLIQLSTCLGNNKPDALLSAERVIWRILFLVADGSLDPCHALIQLKNDLPWKDIHRALEVDVVREWFVLPFDIDNVPENADSAQMTTPSTRIEDCSSQRSRSMASTFAYREEGADVDFSSEEGGNNTLSSYGDIDVFEGDENESDTGSSLLSEDLHAIAEENINVDRSIEEDAERTVNLEGDSIEKDDAYNPNKSPLFLSFSDDESDGGLSSKPMDVDAEESSVSAVSSHADGSDDDEESITVSEVDGRLFAQADIHDPPAIRRSARLIDLYERHPHGPLYPASVCHPQQRKRRKRDTLKDHKSSPVLNANEGIDVDKLVVPSLWEPDDLDEFRFAMQHAAWKERGPAMCISVSTDALGRYPCDGPFVVFGPAGEKFELNPEFDSVTHARRFSRLMSRIAGSYIDGKPVHVVDPVRSVINVLPNHEFIKLGPDAVQNILSAKNIIVTDAEQASCTFSESCLALIHPLRNDVPLRDYSSADSEHCSTPKCNIESQTNFGVGTESERRVEDAQRRRVFGSTLQCLLHEATRPGGKVLGTPRLPLSQQGALPTSYSTDTHAWHQTHGRPCFPANVSFPAASTRWAIATSARAIDPFGIDPDGFNSFHRIVCGLRLCIFRRDNSENPTAGKWTLFSDYASMDKLLDDEQCELEAVILGTGSCLFIQADQPYAFYSEEPSIVHGGYFYLTANMQRTTQSLMRGFVIEGVLSEPNQWRSRRLLNSMIEFYRLGLMEQALNPAEASYEHLPKIHCFKGLVDLLSLCNLVVLGNVLDCRTYSAPNQSFRKAADSAHQGLLRWYDRSDVSRRDRIAIVYARGTALEIMQWVRDFCEIKSPDGLVVADFPSRYLVHQLGALLTFKTQAEQDHLVGVPHCTAELVQRQIENVISCDRNLAQYWTTNRITMQDPYFGIPSTSGYSVRWKDWRANFTPVANILRAGATFLDVRYMQSETRRIRQEELMMTEASSSFPVPYRKRPRSC